MKFPFRPLTLACAVAMAHNATAQLEEIVVTAQKREQSITDVPITISAFTGDFLKELDIDRYDELAELTPGLVVQQQSINNNGYVIRGITSDAGEATHAPRVSVYLNGTDVSRSRGSYFEIYDMERIEVVKGPQPTLFGTASSVGAISFITAKPTEEFAAEIGAGVGNLAMYKVDGMINGGNSLVQGRFAFLKKYRDGYVKNNSDEDNLNGYDRLSYRPSLRITPSDSLTIDLTYMHDEADDTGTAFASEDSLFTGNTNLSVPTNGNLGDNETGVDREVDDFNITVNWDISETMSLSYIGAIREYDSVEVFDADGIGTQFLSFAEDADGEQESHEIRLNIGGDTISGFIGASYFEEEGTQRVAYAGEEVQALSCVGFLPYGCDQLPEGVQTYYYESEYTNGAENDATSVFADFSWAVTERLELTAGLRWTEQSREATYVSNLPDSQYFATLGIETDLFLGRVFNSEGETLYAETDEDVLLPRLSVRYDITDTANVFATWSKGQRPEVVEVSSGEAETTDPEKVTNYEIGIKGSLADDRLDYTVAVYHQDYDDFRVSILNAGGQYIPASAGAATNTGLEADANWLVSESFTLFGNLAYIDAEVDADAGEARYSGNRFRLQPERTAALGYLLDKPMGNGLKWISRGTITYRSSVFFNISNTFEEGAVTLAKLKVGVADVDDRWNIELFANNLFDREYIIDAGNTGNSFGYPTFIEGAPRTYGIQTRIQF
jgi:outer membrane receptor protein involved in Fe transport